MRSYIFFIVLFFATAFINFAAIGEEPTGYLSVTGPCNLEFPKDHAPHPGYRTEWWYYTGNLQAESGERFGFQLTFFRSQISPPDDRQKWPQPPSAWRTQQVYLAHSAISNIAEKKHLQAERVSRAALSMAGDKQNEGSTFIFLNDWSASMGTDRHSLTVTSDRFSYDLSLTPEKPPVMHGMAGYSLKGSTADRASCYYSFTRLNTKGKLSIGEKVFEVKGSAWMDHEYGTAVLESELRGWDWFSLQLSDQTEVMDFVLRKKKGGIGAASSATIVGDQGQSNYIRHSDFILTVLDTWKSPYSKAVYPAGWRLQVYPGMIDLNIHPNLADQEMRTLNSTGEIYWEGSVSVTGTKAGKPVTGKGYVELTGYAKAFGAPM
jgi:predicted secreted hydrolase